MRTAAGVERLVDWAERVRQSLTIGGLGTHEEVSHLDLQAVHKVITTMQGELRAREAPDRELLVRTAALVCGQLTSHYSPYELAESPGSRAEISRSSVALARAIIREVDSEHPGDRTR